MEAQDSGARPPEPRLARGQTAITYRTRFGYPTALSCRRRRKFWRFNGPYNDNVRREREENPPCNDDNMFTEILHMNRESLSEEGNLWEPPRWSMNLITMFGSG